MNNTLFEILVYSCDQKTFHDHMVGSVEHPIRQHAARNSLSALGDEPWTEEKICEFRDKCLERQAWFSGGYPVRYNELVGCIEVHTVCTQLRADWWFAISKKSTTGSEDSRRATIRIGSRIKSIIRSRDVLIEPCYAEPYLTSLEIFQDFRGWLGQAIRRNSLLRKRWVDFEAFDRCGPLVDWRAALGLDKDLV